MQVLIASLLSDDLNLIRIDLMPLNAFIIYLVQEQHIIFNLITIIIVLQDVILLTLEVIVEQYVLLGFYRGVLWCVDWNTWFSVWIWI